MLLYQTAAWQVDTAAMCRSPALHGVMPRHLVGNEQQCFVASFTKLRASAGLVQQFASYVIINLHELRGTMLWPHVLRDKLGLAAANVMHTAHQQA